MSLARMASPVVALAPVPAPQAQHDDAMPRRSRKRTKAKEAPKDRCEVCGQDFVRLKTHQINSKHGKHYDPRIALETLEQRTKRHGRERREKETAKNAKYDKEEAEAAAALATAAAEAAVAAALEPLQMSLVRQGVV